MNKDVNKIKEMRCRNLSIKEISEKLNIPKTTIYRFIKKYNIIKPKLNHRDIIKQYKNGLSVLQLSKKYNCSRNKIQKILNDNHIKKQRNRIVIELDKSLCKNDFSIKNIIKTHNVSKTTALSLRKRYDIKTNDSKLKLDISEIIRLHKIEKMTASEISDIFDCNYGTIINKLGDLYNPTYSFITNTKPERYVANFLKNKNIKFIQNDRTVIKNPHTSKWLELDFYLPELGIAIEVNGRYWHQIKNDNSKKHKLKTKLCEDIGIKLYHIWDDEIEKINELFNKIDEYI